MNYTTNAWVMDYPTNKEWWRVRIECNGDRVSMSKNEYRQVMNKQNGYKQQRDELSEKLDKECNDNYKLEGQLHDMTKQRDSLIKDVEQQRDLLNDFSKFIHRKVEACPGKPEYMDFRDRLKELGIRGSE